ncbi:MAG: (E)-4-hydroxy-3-methylbut-2-enyl-diphosphate synthase [Bacteroidales bacterium]|nr:(E)-4-hydroxy-3-methylbut-2-enyl-diphosphate synthase [Bacteroidales bacterium]
MYIKTLTNYKRFNTRGAKIGKLYVGGLCKIAIQTMCNTATSDIENSVKQIENIVNNTNCDIIRLTVPTLKDAENLRKIKKQLVSKNINIPIVADVHFNSDIAFKCAEFVEKVRINPGNFCSHTDPCLTEEEFENEKKNIEQRFSDFIDVCQKHNCAIRIGTNHGSLSSRILNRFGDTPEGMVYSVMEFLRIAKDKKFNNIVISLKSSNPFVAIRAYRLLCKNMIDEKMEYPLHLGVTEAGEGTDGRLKSFAGIGPLLCDGIGDTIRISLTENPEFEIKPAQELIGYIFWRQHGRTNDDIEEFYDPYNYTKRKSISVNGFGGDNIASTSIFLCDESEVTEFCNVFAELKAEKRVPEVVFVQNIESAQKISSNCSNIKISIISGEQTNNTIKYFKDNEFVGSEEFAFVQIDEKSDFDKLAQYINKNIVLIATPQERNKIGAFRIIFHNLNKNKIDNPVILYPNYNENKECHGIYHEKYRIISPTVESSGTFVDGFGDGICLQNVGDIKQTCRLNYNILQICRLRISGNEYVSCPGCGRTLYDLQQTVKKIKEATSKYSNLKIAVMGCIVNGPGEMADADFGYVGAGIGKISLYKNREVIKQNIPQEQAVEELIKLIENSLNKK